MSQKLLPNDTLGIQVRNYSALFWISQASPRSKPSFSATELSVNGGHVSEIWGTNAT